VTRSGTVLNAGGLPITTASTVVSRPAIASDGTNAFVAWDDYSTAEGAAILGARMSPTGRILDPVEIPVSTAWQRDHLVSPSVAFDGRNYLVVWDHYQYYLGGRVVAARVTPEGTLLDASPIPIARGFDSAVAFDGTNYLVAWASNKFPGATTLLVTRVSPSGTVLDPGIVLARTYGSLYQAVAFNGSNYLVIWSGQDGQIRGARVSPAGIVLDPGGFAIISGANSPTGATLSSDGTDFLVAWSDARFGCCSIFGSRVTGDGRVSDPRGIAIATHGREQVEPAIAYDGTNYLVAWTDNRSRSADIYGARVTPSGRVLDPRGVVLSTGKPLRPCRVPRLAGLSLKRARARLHSAGCSVGGVRRTRSKRQRGVLRQSERPGAVHEHAYPVWLVVGCR
jgi:hypothetical protein